MLLLRAVFAAMHRGSGKQHLCHSPGERAFRFLEGCLSLLGPSGVAHSRLPFFAHCSMLCS